MSGDDADPDSVEITDPLAHYPEDVQIRLLLRDLLTGQRTVIPPVLGLVTAQAVAEERRARLYGALASWLDPRHWGELWGGLPVVARGLVGVGLVLVILRLAGVYVDLSLLAQEAAHAWTGEPHVIECDATPEDVVGPEL